ncbi:MAG: carbonic anhydrase family protein [Planctomycetota bacterium]
MRNHIGWSKFSFVAMFSLFASATQAFPTDPVVKDVHEHPYFHKKEKSGEPEWGYQGKIGPTHWAELSPRFKLAATGKHQSPIDLANMHRKELPSIQFHYKPCRVRLVYNGHTIEDIEEQGSSIRVGDKTYELKQFHFHSPSEHTVNGQHFDMEMHLVHISKQGEIAVIGLFIKQGQANKWFQPVWDYLPSEKNKQRSPNLNVNVEDALPKKRDYASYSGSLTTPPCSENFKWMVLKQPIELSKEQIAAFRRIIDGNNRPTQPLNGREIFSK